MSAGDATGVIVPIIELEPVVRRLRRKADGPGIPIVPAHVTVLFPWLAPPTTEADIAALAGSVADLGPFEFSFREVAWFGEDVVWLKPEPDDHFRELTERVHRRWPDHPPYGGEHDDPTPHLTIGEAGSPDAMREVAAIAERLLPLRCRAEELWVMEGVLGPAAWWRTAVVPLAG